MWQGMEILNTIWKYKLILVETPDSQETSLALETYRTACNNGRGAVLLCVARGKVSEGIDFDHHYGRTVLCIGVPFQYTESRILKARLEFLRETYRIRENDFLSFDAMRHAAQCLGRVLRGKDDYGIMVLADRRFQKKRTQLPKWIGQALGDTEANLSTEQAISIAKRFLKDMSVPYEAKMQEGISNWSVEDLKRYQAKVQDKEIAELQALAQVQGGQGSPDVMEIEDDDLIAAMNGKPRAPQEGMDEYGMDDVDEDALMELGA
jgi:DNA excision repair protein ERCC-2